MTSGLGDYDDAEMYAVLLRNSTQNNAELEPGFLGPGPLDYVKNLEIDCVW